MGLQGDGVIITDGSCQKAHLDFRDQVMRGETSVIMNRTSRTRKVSSLADRPHRHATLTEGMGDAARWLMYAGGDLV